MPRPLPPRFALEYFYGTLDEKVSGERAVTVPSGKSFQWLIRTIPSGPSVALNLSKLSGVSLFFVCEGTESV